MTVHDPGIPSTKRAAGPRTEAGSGACAGPGPAENRARAGQPAPGRGLLQIDLTDPDLPVAGRGALAAVRRSTRGTWRAAVLVLVHVLCLAHIAHYMLAGWTLSPVEPSESMYTLELGWVNAGFLFFTLAILSTLVFGRFFCGWGCHLVAMQDLCAWFMKKLGIRPRPFRSRLLLLVPVTLGFYMFFWPTLRRLLFRIPPEPFPGFSNHLITTDYWRTFAGPLFAVLTIVACGFAAVYFLGAKGFCTYGCPYGALFAAADRLSVGRIVVNEDCEQCGHCTASCSSNVLVHEEVRRYGMVVDPGCMKCTDCVSVCPKGALRFAFARPSLLKRRPAGAGSKKYTLSLGEELFAGAVCAGATLAFRGLYDGPPLLMAVGLGGITALLALKLLHLVTRPTVRLQNLRLKLGGTLGRGGVVFAALAAAWLLFTAHSGFVQWHRAMGERALDRTMAPRAEVLSGTAASRVYPAAHGAATESAFRHFSLAERWGLFGVVEVKLGLAWCHLLRNEPGPAEARIREAIALSPRNMDLRQDLVDVLLARGRLVEATDALQEKLRLAAQSAPAGPDATLSRASVDAGLLSPGAALPSLRAPQLAADQFALGELLARQERLAEAAAAFAACVALAPSSAEARFNYGGVLRRLGRAAEAIEQLGEAARLAPDDADTQVELGLACMAAGRNEEALAALRQAVRLAPDSPESREHLPELIRRLEGSP